MRNLITLGVLSLLGAASLVACGDDDDPGPGVGGTGGTGGSTAGTGGTGGADAGTGGMSAGSGGMAMGGNGGAGGAAPDVTPQATCTGCVELIAPVTGPNSVANLADQAIFQFAPTGGVVDASNAVVTWRVAAVAPSADYFVNIFAQNGQAQNFAGAYQSYSLSPDDFPANEFREVSVDLRGIASLPGDAGVPDAGLDEDEDIVVDAGADAGDAGSAPAPLAPFVTDGFDKSQVSTFGVIVGVGDTFTGSAVVRVAVDEITISGIPGEEPRTFTTGVDGMTLNNYEMPPNTPAPFHHE